MQFNIKFVRYFIIATAFTIVNGRHISYALDACPATPSPCKGFKILNSPAAVAPNTNISIEVFGPTPEGVAALISGAISAVNSQSEDNGTGNTFSTSVGHSNISIVFDTTTTHPLGAQGQEVEGNTEETVDASTGQILTAKIYISR